MNMLQTISATLFWREPDGELQHYETHTDPLMCSDVPEALAALEQGKAALVRGEDAGSVRKAAGQAAEVAG